MRKIVQYRTCLLGLILVFIFGGCNHPSQSAIHTLLNKEKVKVVFTTFFDKKGDKDIANLNLELELKPSSILLQPLSTTGCAVKYDREGEKKTRSSLDQYLGTLLDYERFVIDFTVDSLKIKVFATSKLDILHIIVLNKYNSQYHFIDESFFVYGTILKTTERDIKSKDGDFNDINVEKLTTCLFDENKLFYKSEENEQGVLKKLNYTDDEACAHIQSTFLMRQFCKDVLVKLDTQHHDWFEDKIEQ